MLVELYQSLRPHLVNVSTHGSILLLECLICVLLPWLAWYTFSFVLSPLLNPKSPKELPYIVPILGHALGFIKDSQTLIDYGRQYFGPSKPPFTVTMGGQKLYVLTSPEDVAAVYRNNVTLSWDKMLNELLLGFGVTKTAIPTLWEKLPREILHKARSDLQPHKVPSLSPVHSTLDLYKRQLLPGRHADKINATLIQCIDSSMSMSQMTKLYMMEKRSCIEHISLRHLCNEILVNATTQTFFGSAIYRIAPRIAQHLVVFNQDAWMLVFNYPQKADSKLNIARNQILAAFKAYVQLPSQDRADASWLISSVLTELESLPLTNDDRAALLLMVYWAANINPGNTGFWMLTHIFFNSDLLNSLKQETSQAFRNGGELDLTYLIQNCPQLEAVYHETLRVTNGALSARKITAPTLIGGKVLAAGNTILIPFRQLHYNTDVFGTNSDTFQHDRFLEHPDLINSSSFKPFGGGVNYCPGRFLAKQEILAFTALILNRFDASLSSSLEQSCPELDTKTPALGVNAAKEGQDVLIDLHDL